MLDVNEDAIAQKSAHRLSGRHLGDGAARWRQDLAVAEGRPREPETVPADGIELLPNTPGIYCVWNRVTQRCGVGLASRSVRTRAMQHRSNLRRANALSAPLARDLCEHGLASFLFLLLEQVPHPEIGSHRAALRKREAWWACRLGALDERTGYNLEAGGQRSPASLFRERERKLMRANSRSYRLLPGINIDDPVHPILLETWHRANLVSTRNSESIVNA